MSLCDQFDQFMLSPLHNMWIGDNNIQVYIRKGYHLIHQEFLNTIDIANIQQDVEHRGKGFFKTFIQHVERYKYPVYVECIHNPRLTDMLERNGYTIIRTTGETHAIKQFESGETSDKL